MSLYSTIGPHGIVIDLEEMSSVEYDEKTHTVVQFGGISSKAVAMELAKHGCCTTLPSSNTVGAIPFFLNGGNSPLVSKFGYASDNIVSARMVTAAGEIISVSETENVDLWFAIRGAEQYFGLVVSLTVQTFIIFDDSTGPLNQFWNGRFVFPIERAKEVGEVMERIIDDSSYCSGGIVMVAAPPPTGKPSIVIAARLIHPSSDELQRTVFKQLYDMRPLVSGGSVIPIENIGDALQPLMARGDFKKLRLTGIYSYQSSLLPEIPEVWQELTTVCEDAASSIFSIQWESHFPMQPSSNSANRLHKFRCWANILTWCTKAENVNVAQTYMERAIAVTRKGQQRQDFVDFPNSLREPESLIQRRYPHPHTLQLLKATKHLWDPKGVFGKELL